MNCQRCRSPLKLDGSLQDINSAAFDLLVGSTGKSLEHSTATARLPFPQERKDLYNKAFQDASSPVFKRVIPQTRHGFGSQPAMAASTKAGLKDNPAMSFVMLTDSQVVPPQPTKNGEGIADNPKPNAAGITPQRLLHGADNFSDRVESITRLFEIVSARSDIDHPICTECTELLLTSLQNRLTSTTKERDAYINFLKTLKNNPPSQSEISKAESALKAAREEEARAFAELVALEKEKSSLDAEVADLEAESMALDAEEQAFWRDRNAFALKLTSFQNERDALNAAYEHDNQQLERLQRTNVYNDTFCIGHDGYFGTINGLRLGRLPPPQNVDCTEINAAWGTTALLLNTVADKLGFTFRGYRIKPMGSMSRIEKIEYISAPGTPTASQGKSASGGPNSQMKVTSFDLFSSGDLPIGRVIFHRQIDNGMVAFLECLRQLGEFVQTGDVSGAGSSRTSNKNTAAGGKSTNKTKSSAPASSAAVEPTTALPYRIHKDKIDDVSIKLGVSQDEAWTRAFDAMNGGCPSSKPFASHIATDWEDAASHSLRVDAIDSELSKTPDTQMGTHSVKDADDHDETMVFTSDTDIDALFLANLADIAAENRTVDPDNFRTPSPKPESKPVSNTRRSHNVVHRPIRVTEKEIILLKRMQAFVEEYENLKQELGTSKKTFSEKYKRMNTRLDRFVQIHLKNGVPRFAESKAVKTRKQDAQAENGGGA